MMYIYSESKAEMQRVEKIYANWAKSVAIDLTKPAKLIFRVEDRVLGNSLRLKFSDRDMAVTVSEEVFVPYVVDKNLEDYL